MVGCKRLGVSEGGLPEGGRCGASLHRMAAPRDCRHQAALGAHHELFNTGGAAAEEAACEANLEQILSSLSSHYSSSSYYYLGFIFYIHALLLVIMIIIYEEFIYPHHFL